VIAVEELNDFPEEIRQKIYLLSGTIIISKTSFLLTMLHNCHLLGYVLDFPVLIVVYLITDFSSYSKKSSYYSNVYSDHFPISVILE